MTSLYQKYENLSGWLGETLESVKEAHKTFMNSRMWEFSNRINGKDGQFVGRFEIGYLSEVQYQQQATGFMRDYIMANPALMRNSIRRPERLVWYIDVGVDNDGNNAVQNFIRTIKQREVKFSNLKDITTTINQIGEFHDFYVPTYNGERPVEVETLNMGGASEVDSPFLEYLRKAIIGGMGVPAAFVGYSEEVAFARSLTMDNGRFLRRVVRHQKHYGKAASKVYQILYRNEYISLDQLTGAAKQTDPDEKKPDEKDASEGKSKAKGKAGQAKSADAAAEAENRMDSVEISQIFVRFPSPATLNLTNMSDAINQAQPVSDFLVETVAAGESDETKGAFKKRVMRELMPQVHWDRYEKMLEEARVEAERKKVNPPSDGAATA
jgi:acylphosphatase